MGVDRPWRLVAITLLLAVLTCLSQLGTLPINRIQELRVFTPGAQFSAPSGWRAEPVLTQAKVSLWRLSAR